MAEENLKLLKGFLEKDYRSVLSQVTIMRKKIDLLCIGDDKLIAVEVKSRLGEIPMAMGQCMFYREGVHEIYVALPAPEAARASDEMRILKGLGIGFMSFSEKGYKILLKSRKTVPRKDLTRPILKRAGTMNHIESAVEGYKALANSTRLMIYIYVSERGEAGLKEIVSETGESYPLIIKHLKVLESAGLIESEKLGKETVLKLKSYPMEINEGIIKRKILHLMSLKGEQGLTIQDVSGALGISKGTISKYFWLLEAEGKIHVKNSGNKRLHYPGRRPGE